MTFGKYIITTLFKSIKMYNGAQSLAYANSELRLMNEGLKLLGFYNHGFIEEIDDLKSAYWEIEDKKLEIEELEKEEIQLKEKLQEDMGDTSEKEQNNNEDILLLQGEHRDLLRQQQDLSAARTNIEEEGRRLLKIHKGLKAEREHLTDNEAVELDQKIKSCLLELKALKAERDQITIKDSQLVQGIEERKSQIQKTQKAGKVKVSSQSSISESNQNLTNNIVEQKKRLARLDELYFQIGEYLVENQKIKEVKNCIKSNKRILAHLKALTTSMRYHRLLGHR